MRPIDVHPVDVIVLPTHDRHGSIADHGPVVGNENRTWNRLRRRDRPIGVSDRLENVRFRGLRDEPDRSRSRESRDSLAAQRWSREPHRRRERPIPPPPSFAPLGLAAVPMHTPVGLQFWLRSRYTMRPSGSAAAFTQGETMADASAGRGGDMVRTIAPRGSMTNRDNAIGSTKSVESPRKARTPPIDPPMRGPRTGESNPRSRSRASTSSRGAAGDAGRHR